MSAHQNKIPESKSKSKFQSLNINTIYQVTQTEDPFAWLLTFLIAGRCQ